MGKKVISGKTDFLTLCPELQADFIPELNEGINPAQLGIGSNKVLYWRCHVCGYEWDQSIHGRRRKNENGEYKAKQCPSCNKHVRTTSYAEEYPDLIDLYDEDSNEIPLSEITGGRVNDKFVWKCKQHGVFTASLKSMIRSIKTDTRGCPFCSGKKVKYEESFGAKHSDLTEEWSPSNKKSPFEYSEHSHKEVEWKCKSGHLWKAIIKERAQGHKKCPVCFHERPILSFAQTYPDYKKYYDSDNETPFEKLLFSDSKRRRWHCNKGHPFERSAKTIHQAEGKFVCPICNHSILVPGVNDLETEYPEFAKYYDREKNDISPGKISPYDSNPETYWLCAKGHSFQRSVYQYVFVRQKCLYCDDYRVMVGYNDLTTTDPELAAEWSPNNKKKPTEVQKSHSFYAKWICPICKHEYGAVIRDREVGDDSCPYCNDTYANPGFNDLQTINPELAAEWSPRNELKPDKVKATTGKYFLWTCPVCHGTYGERLNQRRVGDNKCPYCNGKKVLSGFNDLQTLEPELAEEWSGNNLQDATRVMRSSKKSALWICPDCGGEYRAKVCDREIDDDACPFCKNNRVLVGLNDLATTDPELAAEWSPNNKKVPTQVMKAHTKKVKWICPDCGAEYTARVCDREFGDNRCPYCVGNRTLTGVNDLTVTDPELAKEWSDSNERPANSVKNSYVYLAKWICPDCGGEYSARVCDRKTGDALCPYCNENRFLSGYNDLTVTDPELAKEWSDLNERPASSVRKDFTYSAKWICPDCGGEYTAKVCDRERGDKSCPYCNKNRLLSGYNDLTVTDPKLASEWSDTNERPAMLASGENGPKQSGENGQF